VASLRIVGKLRQSLYPAEFRIPAPEFPSELVGALRRLTETASPELDALPRPEINTTAELSADLRKEQFRFLADIGTGLWRLRQKMVQPGTDRPVEEMRKAYRHFESVWDALSKAGLEVRDHVDTPYDAGLALNVIAFQPTPGLERERVIETIKPTIYFKDLWLQMGEVIVGTPELASATDREPSTAD